MACKYLHIVNAITADDDTNVVTFTFSNAVSAQTNQQKFCFKIPCSVTIPSGSSDYTVSLTINGVAVPLWDRYGNPATMSELSKNRVYAGYYGATTPHVICKAPITYNTGCNNVL